MVATKKPNKAVTTMRGKYTALPVLVPPLAGKSFGALLVPVMGCDPLGGPSVAERERARLRDTRRDRREGEGVLLRCMRKEGGLGRER